MHYEGDDYVSLLDFIEILCKIDKNDTIKSISIDFCGYYSSKYSFEGSKCFKAEALDKTKHILVPVELVLEIFTRENIKRTIVFESFDTLLNALLSKSYIISGSTCCCCPKKLKKAVAHAASFTEFVRQGQKEVRRFQSLMPKINFLVSLDIEGNSKF